MRRRVLGGLAWTGASQVVTQVVRLVVAITLARLLSPQDYGIAAIAIVFSGLVLIFSDLALGAALVQRKHLSEDDRCTAFWMAIGAGALFTALGLLLAGPIAAFYGQPAVKPLCAVLASTFLITSLATTHEALLLRDMEFGKLERRAMVATLVGATAGVTVAIITRDAWALIAQQVVDALVSTVLLWRLSSWRPRARVSAASLRALGSFSSYLVGHRLLFYFHRNADNMLIGRFVGAAALGVYTIAYNIMLFPFSRIAGPVQRVLGPTFSRIQDDPQRIGDMWVRAVRLVGSLSIPALLGLVVVAPDFVHVVLGEKWAGAVPLIQILAWVGIVQSLQSVNTDILQARGRASTIFRFTVLFTSAHFAAFIIGLHWGVIGVAVGYAVSTTLVEPVGTLLTARSIGLSPWRVVRGLRGVVEAALVMMAAVVVTRMALVDLAVAPFPRLVACVAVGGLVYSALYPWLARDGWTDVRELVGDVRAWRGRSLAGVPAETSTVG